jgi:two-component system chemotaxis sensor kinase CheA
MVPIRSTFQKMTRLVRDLSMKAGKQVELQMSGEDTELDRTIVEEISDPLVHMIRNAVDHGIEPADRRLAAGKSPHGNIRLRAFHQGGNIVIEVEDDGGGLSRERILRKAIERGLVAEGAQLSDSAILNLIFAPGFSTAEKVTDISGRGVGMDVVRRNIEKLRGKVEIQSTPGKGSRFTIYLPLTLAIIDGMIVGIGGQRYILPTLAVRESFRPAAGMVSTVQGRAEVVNVRGRLMPLVRLHALFGTPSRATRPEDGIIIVVESDHGARCVLVDDLLGKQEVVIKSLGQTFKKSAAVAGAAILGDGRVGLILDVDGIMGMQPPVYAAAA